MARILSVTFETEADAEPGRFTIPRPAAQFLGIRPDDEVELVVMCGGLKLELSTRLGRSLEVVHRVGDEATASLLQVPAHALLEVTIWGPDVPADTEGPAPRAEPWTPKQFDPDIDRRVGPVVGRRARTIRDWAEGRGLRIWWGRGRERGGWIPVFDARSGRGYSFFEVWTDGRVEVQFKNMKANPAFRGLPPREEFHRRLVSVPGVTLPDGAIERFPSFRLADLPDDTAVQKLLEAFDWVLDEFRKGDP